MHPNPPIALDQSFFSSLGLTLQREHFGRQRRSFFFTRDDRNEPQLLCNKLGGLLYANTIRCKSLILRILGRRVKISYGDRGNYVESYILGYVHYDLSLPGGFNITANPSKISINTLHTTVEKSLIKSLTIQYSQLQCIARSDSVVREIGRAHV